MPRLAELLRDFHSALTQVEGVRARFDGSGNRVRLSSPEPFTLDELDAFGLSFLSLEG